MKSKKIAVELDGRTLRREKARRLTLRQRRALLAALALAAQADRVLASKAYRLAAVR